MDELKNFWNKSSSKVPTDKDPSSYALEKEKQFPEKADVCDLGGGTGVDAIYFIKNGHNVTLVDISDFALQTATKKAKELNLDKNLLVIQKDLSEGNLPLPDSSFNVVFSRLALHYFLSSRLSNLLREVNRVLKPGGKAFITLKSPEDIEETKYLKRTAKEIEDGVFEEEGQIKTRFKIDKLREIVRHAGITDFEVNNYTENFNGRVDKVKSGKEELLLNEIVIIKTKQ